MAILALPRLRHRLAVLGKEQLGPPIAHAGAGPSGLPKGVDALHQVEVPQIPEMALRTRDVGPGQLGLQLRQLDPARFVHKLQDPALFLADLVEQLVEHVAVGHRTRVSPLHPAACFCWSDLKSRVGGQLAERSAK